MNGLISFKNFALNTTQSVSREILELNEISKEYGLVLSEEDAVELSETRSKALVDNDRIEIGVGAIAEIIKRFSKSRYVNADDYAYVLNEITDIFYYIKTETDDKVDDDELLDELFKRFELNCRGSMDLLLGREAERLIRKINSGENYGRWYAREDANSYEASRDTHENVLRDEYDENLWSEDEDCYLEEEEYDEDDDIDAELDSFDEYLDALANEEDGDEPDEDDFDDEEDEDDGV